MSDHQASWQQIRSVPLTAERTEMFDRLNRLPTEVEMVVWRQKFIAFADELVKAGLKQSQEGTANRKMLVYLLKVTQANTAQEISAQQWEEFFNLIGQVRDSQELPALVQYIESLSTPPVPQGAPSFSAEDKVILNDAGISTQDDLRAPSKYWKCR
jgi:hypothetical protein